MTDTSSIAGGPKPVFPNTLTGTPSADTDRGTPLYANAGEFTAAIASAAATARVVGLNSSQGVAGEHGMELRYSGPMKLTTAEWDARVTGQSGGLTPGAEYYLSTATAGKLQVAVPAGGGTYITPIGIALDAETLMLQISAARVVGG